MTDADLAALRSELAALRATVAAHEERLTEVENRDPPPWLFTPSRNDRDLITQIIATPLIPDEDLT